MPLAGTVPVSCTILSSSTSGMVACHLAPLLDEERIVQLRGRVPVRGTLAYAGARSGRDQREPGEHGACAGHHDRRRTCADHPAVPEFQPVAALTNRPVGRQGAIARRLRGRSSDDEAPPAAAPANGIHRLPSRRALWPAAGPGGCTGYSSSRGPGLCQGEEEPYAAGGRAPPQVGTKR